MYVGGLLPGLFMILALSALGVARSVRDKVPRVPFQLREAIAALRGAALEILLPVFVLLFYFLGIMTVVETAAFSVVYVFLAEVLVHRDIRPRRIPEVILKAAAIIGGVLVILAVANGLSYFIVDAQISERFAGWLHASVRSKYVFLLLLNLALLVKGIFIDVFSAIAVLVPLIVPVGASYGINSIHLGIIFLANLELGYLTPPVGLNLQFAAYRFNKPVSRMIRDVAPFLLVLLAAVLLITYLPAMTTLLLDVFHFSGASSSQAG